MNFSTRGVKGRAGLPEIERGGGENDLRDKVRRAFHAIKRNIQFDMPIRIWLKILELPIKNSQNGTKLRLGLQNSAQIYFVYKTPNNELHFLTSRQCILL
jgi:hypothetical protein